MGSVSGNNGAISSSCHVGPEEEFCLRWNDFRDSIASSLLELRSQKEFLDVSLLLADSEVVIPAHRVVLSACSSFFRSLLSNKHLGHHPVIVLTDVSPEDLDSVLAFMYNGEVKVRQDDLNSFLRVAEKLRVRGLCQGDKTRTANKTHQNLRRRGSTNSNRESGASPTPSGPLIKRPKTEVPSRGGGDNESARDNADEVNSHNNNEEEFDDSDDGDELVIDDDRHAAEDNELNNEDCSSPQTALLSRKDVQLKNRRRRSSGSKDQEEGGPDESPGSHHPEEYSEYGYAPDEGYNDKTIPPPVVGMTLGDRLDSILEMNSIKTGPWNSPNSGNSLNRFQRLSSGGGAGDGFGGRRPRSVYTTQQLTQLEAYFKFNEYIDGDRKKQLSIITQIPEQQIKVWFQNRRQKKKRELEEIQHNSSSSSQQPILEATQQS